MKTWDPFREEVSSNPYPLYRAYRDEAAAFLGSGDLGKPGVYLFTHEAVTASLRDPRFIKSMESSLPPVAERDPFTHFYAASMLMRDPPDHTRLRALVGRAFVPAMVERLKPRVHALADGLLEGARRRGSMDLIADFAFPLPVTVICELLGIDPERRADFRRWSRDITAAVDISQTRDVFERAARAAAEVIRYLRLAFAERRAQPRQDLISALISAEDEGGRLSEDEALSMALLLLVAGHETTVNLIGNGLLALLRHPQQMRFLQEDPSLMPRAVDELLRFDSPIQATHRITAAPITIGGVDLKPGDVVFPLIGSANHDPAVWDRPDELDITRDATKHRAFGFGIHYCLGASLARAEAQAALSLLLALPGLEIAGEPVWRRAVTFHGLLSLPLCFTPTDR